LNGVELDNKVNLFVLKINYFENLSLILSHFKFSLPKMVWIFWKFMGSQLKTFITFEPLSEKFMEWKF